MLHGQLRLGHQPEAPQYAEQLAVTERLAATRETDPLRRRLQQRVRRVRLEQTGLLVVAVAVDDTVRPTERARGVHRVESLVDPWVLSRRHLVHHLARG